VSGQRQKEEQTVGSQVAECKTAAASWGLAGLSGLADFAA
jgi:hypothetical protein